MFSFFSKENILISRRYQLHTTPQQRITLMAVRMHTAKNRRRKKSHYGVKVLVATTQTPPIQLQKSKFSKSDASKKETMQKHRRRPIIDLRFHPEESLCSQNNVFNKNINRL
jgi:hypothetical protein